MVMVKDKADLGMGGFVVNHSEGEMVLVQMMGDGASEAIRASEG